MRSGSLLFAFVIGLAFSPGLLPASVCFAQAPGTPAPVTPAPAPPAPAPPPADDAAYRAAVDDAVAEFAAGRFEEARALFRRAHALSPNARTLRGLGMAAFELRAYVQAIRDLRAALADTRKPLEGELRRKAEELIENARKFVGVVRIVKVPANATLLIDGKPPEPEPDGSLLLDAGKHGIAATAPEHKTGNVRVLVEGESDQTVYVTLESLKIQQAMIAPIDADKIAAEPAPAAEPVQPAQPAVTPVADQPQRGTPVQVWAVGTLIGAGVFGSTGAIFWMLGNGQESELEMTCAPSCSDRQLDDSGLKTSDLLTNVFLGLGAASALASAVLFIVSATDSDEPGAAASTRAAAPTAALRLGPLGASIAGSF